METDNTSEEQTIMIDSELSAMQKLMKSRTVRRCKVFCNIEKIISIAGFILIVFLIALLDVPSLPETVKNVSDDTAAPVFDDSVTEQTLIEKKIVQLRGQVSLIKMGLIKDVNSKLSPIFTFLIEFQCFGTETVDYQTGSEYNYTVCPFEQIFQSYELTDESREMDLGSWDGEMDLKTNSENQHVLAMYYNNGSTEFCVDRNTTFPRSTEIYYFCGWSNHIGSVNEWKECRYTIMFSVNCTVANN